MNPKRWLTATAALLLLFAPQLTAVQAASERKGDYCADNPDDTDCQREKPRFQTRFFSE